MGNKKTEGKLRKSPSLCFRISPRCHVSLLSIQPLRIGAEIFFQILSLLPTRDWNKSSTSNIKKEQNPSSNTQNSVLFAF